MSTITFELAVEHADHASFSRSVDPTATRRIKALWQQKKGAAWRSVTLVDVDYGKYEAGVGKCVSVYKYEIDEVPQRPLGGGPTPLYNALMADTFGT